MRSSAKKNTHAKLPPILAERRKPPGCDSGGTQRPRPHHARHRRSRQTLGRRACALPLKTRGTTRPIHKLAFEPPMSCASRVYLIAASNDVSSNNDRTLPLLVHHFSRMACGALCPVFSCFFNRRVAQAFNCSRTCSPGWSGAVTTTWQWLLRQFTACNDQLRHSQCCLTTSSTS